MGFALWFRDGEAWAQGTHEYRPMGTAVIAASQLFHLRDFSRARKAPARRSEGFQGLFGSLEDLNIYLRSSRGKPRQRLTYKRGRLIPLI